MSCSSSVIILLIAQYVIHCKVSVKINLLITRDYNIKFAMLLCLLLKLTVFVPLTAHAPISALPLTLQQAN